MSIAVGVLYCLLGSLGACGADEWVIGQVAPFSGPSAQIGNDLRAGASIALNGVNLKGGVAGKKLRLVTEDDAQDAVKAIKATKQLLAQDQPIAFIDYGSNETAAAVRSAHILNGASVPIIGPYIGGKRIAGDAASPAFLTRASYRDEVDALMRQSAVLGLTRFAVIYQQDAIGEELLAAAEEVAKHYKLKIVAKAPYSPAPNTASQIVVTPDVRLAVDATIRTPHEAVLVMVTDPAVTAALVANYQATQGAGVMMVLSAIDGESIAQRIGNARARGLWVSQTVPSFKNLAAPLIRKFLNDLRTGGASDSDIENLRLTSTMLEGYIAMQVVVEGLRRSGPTADPAKLSLAIQDMRDFDLGGYRLNFSAKTTSGSHYVDIGVLDQHGVLAR